MDSMKFCLVIFAAITTATCAPTGQGAAVCPSVSPLKEFGRYLGCSVNLQWSRSETINKLKECPEFQSTKREVVNLTRSIFHSVDTNRDGSISKQELRTAYQSMNFNESSAEWSFQVCDVNSDDVISVEENDLCTVQFYGKKMMEYITPCSRRFTKTNMEDAIADIARNFYSTVTTDQQKEIIDNLHEDNVNNYDIIDLVNADFALANAHFASISKSAP